MVDAGSDIDLDANRRTLINSEFSTSLKRMVWPKSMDHLAALSASIAHIPSWSGLAAYFDLRSKGLRTEAMSSLDAFAKDASSWPFGERLSLVQWLGANDELNSPVIPFPLCQKVHRPTIVEWLEAQPRNADANFFYAIYVAGSQRDLDPADFLNIALEIEPRHQKALRARLEWLLRGVEYAQHELPVGYLGSPDEDLVELQMTVPLAERIKDREIREEILTKLDDLSVTTQKWITFNKDSLPDDCDLRFQLWQTLRGD